MTTRSSFDSNTLNPVSSQDSQPISDLEFHEIWSDAASASGKPKAPAAPRAVHMKHDGTQAATDSPLSSPEADGTFAVAGANTANLFPLTMMNRGQSFRVADASDKPPRKVNAPFIIPDMIIVPDNFPGKGPDDDGDGDDDAKVYNRSEVTGAGWGFDHVVRNQLLPNGTSKEQNVLRDALSQVFREEHPDRDYLIQHELLLHGENFDKVKQIIEAQDPKLWQSIEAKMKSDVSETWNKAHGTGYYHDEKIGGGDYDYRDHPTKEGKKHDPDHRLYSLKDFLEGKKDEKGRDVCVAVAVDKKVINKAWDGTYEHRPQLRIPEMNEKYKDELKKLGKDSICFVAVDIGSKIKGHHVDIRVDSKEEAQDIPDKVTVVWLKRPVP